MSKPLGFNVELPLSFDVAVTRVREALEHERFGVLTEIDLRAAFREKLGREFRPYANQIEAKYDLTPGGVRVIETSHDAYVAELLQAHAEVLSAFIANGRSEMMKNHPLPRR